MASADQVIHNLMYSHHSCRCSDKRLKADISSLCARITTIGVQLKIVASVKATCGDEDAAQADAMLINSASNLMDGALHLVRACEASSLKMLPADAVVSAEEPVEIVWRKRLNRGGLANRSSVLYGGRPGSYLRA